MTNERLEYKVLTNERPVLPGSSLAVSWAPSMAGWEVSTDPSLRHADTSLTCRQRDDHSEASI